MLTHGLSIYEHFAGSSTEACGEHDQSFSSTDERTESLKSQNKVLKTFVFLTGNLGDQTQVVCKAIEDIDTERVLSASTDSPQTERQGVHLPLREAAQVQPMEKSPAVRPPCLTMCFCAKVGKFLLPPAFIFFSLAPIKRNKKRTRFSIMNTLNAQYQLEFQTRSPNCKQQNLYSHLSSSR